MEPVLSLRQHLETVCVGIEPFYANECYRHLECNLRTQTVTDFALALLLGNCQRMSPLGLEPRTHGLKGRCSAIELGTRTHESNYTP